MREVLDDVHACIERRIVDAGDRVVVEVALVDRPTRVVVICPCIATEWPKTAAPSISLRTPSGFT